MKKHVLITMRYSLVGKRIMGSFISGRSASNFQEYKKSIFDATRMAAREQNLKNIVIPSLRKLNLTSINGNLKLFIITSQELPAKNLSNLIEITKDLNFVEIISLPPENNDLSIGIKSYVEKLNDDDVYASLRLDDDDALSLDFVEHLSSYMNHHFDGFCVSYPRGFSVFLENGNIKALSESYIPKTAIGLALIRSAKSLISHDKKLPIDIYEAGNHTKIDYQFPTILDGRKPMYLRSIHATQDTKMSELKNMKNVLLRADAEDVLRNFGVDLDLIDSNYGSV